MTATLRLENGDSACVIAPALGGAVISLQLEGVAVFREAQPSCADILQTSCFTMVPFGNRLVSGELRGGRRVALPPDPAAHSHAMHGHGWRRAWTVLDRAADSVTLGLTHSADAWPWPYRVEQQFALRAGALRIALVVTNLSSDAMPCGFGIHPYFTLEPSSFVESNADRCLAPDKRGVPSRIVPWPPGRIALVAAPPCDHFLLDNGGSIIVGTDCWRLAIRASEVMGWQLYRPPSGAFFCVEPVSHLPNQLNTFIEGNACGNAASMRWNVEVELTSTDVLERRLTI